MQYIINAGGITTAAQYPFAPGTQRGCRYTPSMVAVQVVGYTNVPNNERALLQVGIGPVFVTLCR